MKTKKKMLIALVSVMLILVATVFGTFAYLMDSQAVTNTFTVGRVDITVDEADTNEEGQPLDKEGNVVEVEKAERTEEGNEYHLIPGKTYVKDPTMTVAAGSDQSYVRMIVTINCYNELQAIFDNAFLPQDFVQGWDSEVWISTGDVAVDTTTNTATYEFRYFEPVDVSEETDGKVLDALFDSFTLPSTINGDELNTLTGLTITVEGHAIQAAGFIDMTDADGNIVSADVAEDAAWKAFGVQYEAEKSEVEGTQP